MMNAIVASVLAEWRVLEFSALQFWQRDILGPSKRGNRAVHVEQPSSEYALRIVFRRLSLFQEFLQVFKVGDQRIPDQLHQLRVL